MENTWKSMDTYANICETTSEKYLNYESHVNSRSQIRMHRRKRNHRHKPVCDYMHISSKFFLFRVSPQVFFGSNFPLPSHEPPGSHLQQPHLFSTETAAPNHWELKFTSGLAGARWNVAMRSFKELLGLDDGGNSWRKWLHTYIYDIWIIWNTIWNTIYMNHIW